MSRHKHCYRLHLNTLNDGNEADWVIGVWRGSGIGAWATIWLTIFITETISYPMANRYLFSAPHCSIPLPLIDRFTIGRALMDAHSYSHPWEGGDRSVNWICDFRSIFEVFTRLSIAIISPGQLFYDNRRRTREETRWIVDSLQRSGFSSFCPDLAFSPLPTSGKLKNGNSFGWGTIGINVVEGRVPRKFLQLELSRIGGGEWYFSFFFLLGNESE